MNAWFHLVKKEMRLGFVAFLIPIVAFIVCLMMAVYLKRNSEYIWEVVGTIAFIATGMTILYLVYFLFITLNTEQKRLHLWLHSPMKGYGLLSAKLVSGFIYLLFTMFITGAVGWISYRQSEISNISFEGINIGSFVFFIVAHLLWIAVSFAIVFMLFCVIYLVLKKYLPSFFSFVVTFLLFVLFVVLYGYFAESSVYEWLTMWGKINLSEQFYNFPFLMEILTPEEEIELRANASIYIGFYVFEGLVSLAMFLLASWLLDRKVEV